MQRGRNSTSPRVSIANDLAINSQFTPHRQRPTPLRRTIPLSPPEKPSSQLRDPRSRLKRRRLLDRTPKPHSIRLDRPLTLKRNTAHKLPFLSPHRFDSHRIRTKRFHIHQRSGLCWGFLERQHAIRGWIQIWLRYGGWNQHG